MQFNVITAGILVGMVFLVGIYDVIAGLIGGYDATVTAVVIHWQNTFPPLSVAVGFVLGHLFWPAKVGIITHTVVETISSK